MVVVKRSWCTGTADSVSMATIDRLSVASSPPRPAPRRTLPARAGTLYFLLSCLISSRSVLLSIIICQCYQMRCDGRDQKHYKGSATRHYEGVVQAAVRRSPTWRCGGRGEASGDHVARISGPRTGRTIVHVRAHTHTRTHIHLHCLGCRASI